MKVVYTKHAIKKFSDLLMFGIKVTKSQITKTVGKPKYQSKDNGNEITVSDFDDKHNLRVVHKIEKGVIIIITFYVYRKGRYAEY